MGYGETYGSLLEAIAEEADAIAMRYFRADELRIERKGDGTAVTQADRSVEEMARARVAGSGLALDVLGEEMGGGDAQSASTSGRARMIIDPIDGTEEFSRGIPTFGTLIGIEVNGQIVAGMASAPGLGSRWWAYRGEGAYRNGKRIHVSSVDTLSRATLDWRVLAAHACRRGRNGSCGGPYLSAMGSCPAGNYRGGGGGPLDESAWREDDLFGAARQHERKDSRRGAEDSGVRWRHGRPHTS